MPKANPNKIQIRKAHETIIQRKMKYKEAIWQCRKQYLEILRLKYKQQYTNQEIKEWMDDMEVNSLHAPIIRFQSVLHICRRSLRNSLDYEGV